MEQPGNTSLSRIAIFYDGNYFAEVSNYYRFQHERQARIDLRGLHNFVRYEVAQREKKDEHSCQIVEAHYFRGRFSADAALQKNSLEADRRFDDVLIRAGIVQHYYPMDERGARPQEKGIDVWLALEAYDLAVHKRFDVLALVACDGDYVPLVRKLNGIGTRVMLLAWDFKYSYNGRDKETRTAQTLISECSYPIMMHDEIDSRSRKNDAV
ncbi:MAG TPA: NYN domain-containing protein, partial [Gammaproteobacteria bacterium]|nr:NYN domain-containing protein [Gammaproteobacteria bacterium]